MSGYGMWAVQVLLGYAEERGPWPHPTGKDPCPPTEDNLRFAGHGLGTDQGRGKVKPNFEITPTLLSCFFVSGLCFFFPKDRMNRIISGLVERG